MVIRRCPLCWIKPETGVVEHLRSDHHRSEIEACTLLERAYRETLGSNAEGRKKDRRTIGSRKLHPAMRSLHLVP